MCGISGIYQFKNSDKNILIGAIEKMNQSQILRGPDDEGIFIDEQNGICLGHRRLSILDLSTVGKQPMRFAQSTTNNQQLTTKGDFWITFNGEIYNFLELKKELEKKGYKFKTKTDTEVILALYVEYGEKSFSLLRGMFAFGLWDGVNKKLFLVKDRYGIKPLYYYSSSEKLVFASTVKALEASGIVPRQKNSDAIIGFLLFGSVPLPMTTIKNVLAVPSGYYLEINAEGNQKLIKYYDVLDAFVKKSTDNFEQAKQKIRDLLEKSVKSHLISDAPLGVFLSGGLDSSAVVALATNADQRGLTRMNKNLKTLSIIFDEKEFSEQKYQQLVAQKIKSDHREIKITKNNFFDLLEEVFETMDQPTIDGINTFFIAKAAKEAGLKVVLSGLGADEIFCGYSHFRKAVLLRQIQKLPMILKFPLWLFSFFNNRYSRLSYLLSDGHLYFYLAIRGLFSPREVARILDVKISEIYDFIGKLNNSLVADCQLLVAKLHPVNLLSYLELKFYLQNQLLKDTDFMSMRHSVEVRVPFLDHKLVEYVSNVSPELKLGNKINKPLLVESVRDLLPQEIFNRPKMGFTFPFEKWLTEENSKFQIPNYKNKGHWSRFWAEEVLKKFLIKD